MKPAKGTATIKSTPAVRIPANIQDATSKPKLCVVKIKNKHTASIIATIANINKVSRSNMIEYLAKLYNYIILKIL